MPSIFNGIGAGELRGADWIKASVSDGVNECVELAEVGENIAVRNSRDPMGPALIFTRRELSAFMDGVLNGEFQKMIV
ncbi:DUF397 domain-containing protein [Streptomyces sp. NPDC058280]|uniref:DUF397 domain-containing protein n=1 Tax=Streptomyces sp. NPDC058280 TaxID=3346419 RepID=UPI0036E476A5